MRIKTRHRYKTVCVYVCERDWKGEREKDRGRKRNNTNNNTIINNKSHQIIKSATKEQQQNFFVAIKQERAKHQQLYCNKMHDRTTFKISQ